MNGYRDLVIDDFEEGVVSIDHYPRVVFNHTRLAELNNETSLNMTMDIE
jgi:hypothetical protein